MEMQVFVLIVGICICASAIHGSAEYQIASSVVSFLSDPHGDERAPNFGYHEKSLNKAILPALLDRYIRDRSLAYSPTHSHDNERKSDFSNHEETPTLSKSSSSPLANEVSQMPVKSMSSVTPAFSPPRDVVTPSMNSQGLSPHVAPSISHGTSQGPVESLPSIAPIVLPPITAARPPKPSQGLPPHIPNIYHGIPPYTSQEPVKSLPSIPPAASPPINVETPPKTSEGLPPHILPNISHSMAPNTSQEPIKSMPSVSPTMSPPSNVATPPKTSQELPPHTLPKISHSMAPNTNREPVKSMPPVSPTMSPPSNVATPPQTSQVLPPHLLPNISRNTKPNDTQSPVKSMLPVPSTASPPSNVAPPPETTHVLPPHMQPNISHSTSPNTSQGPIGSMPSIPPTVSPPGDVVMPPKTSQGLPPHMLPNISHSMAPDIGEAPVKPLPPIPPTVSPPRNVAAPPKSSRELPPHMLPNVSHGTAPDISPAARPILPEPAVIPIPARPPSSSGNQHNIPVAAPSNGHFLPLNHSHTIGASPAVSPMPQKGTVPRHDAVPPNGQIPKHLRKWFHSHASSPSVSSNNHSSSVVSSPAPGPSSSVSSNNHSSSVVSSPAPGPSYSLPRPTFVPQASSVPPTRGSRKSRQRHHNPPSAEDGPSASPPSPLTSIGSSVSPVASPPSAVPSRGTRRPVLSPMISPLGSYTKNPKAPLPAQVLILPPPPPNRDCSSLTCTEPLTNRPPGSPCGCVVPMRVGLELSVALYTFFPLVSELAEEIASGVFMKQSQVRIIGANAASQELDKTIVLIDLVPLGNNFDASSALSTCNRFWHKQVIIQRSFFGEYKVLYVNYPGLPPSPPSAPLSVSTIDGGPHFGQDSSATMLHPLGVDVSKKQKKGLSGSMIAIIVVSSSIALGLCIGAVWLLLLKGAKCNTDQNSCLPKLTSPTSGPSSVRPTGGAGSKTFESGPSSTSFSSSMAAYAGTAKTFTLEEMERATDNFDSSRILGEGGFGLVYSGVVDDGTKVAIKVLKRDDQHGGREFMAEVEMLSRLHHRNLVKLIGICVEGHARCLVYELIANGSLESHLHGVDKEAAPLNWGARMKIALGAARGLAYLHEDSSPRVIHRDFKASNILLEDDYTPKVSDFGLARTALDEESKHISTRVMGTFGYVAPEYAMTGHLLVKSDVYSYGVVLLELLTGRKPVDMSQPIGQENLVAWARPLLTRKEGLEMVIDPSLGSDFPFDFVAKVAAIASMCVQPEVSHRPFMGEVVQALKLVCEECEETKELTSECGSRDDMSTIDKDIKIATTLGHAAEMSSAHYPMLGYFTLDNQRALSASDIFNRSATFGRQTSGSFRRHSSSGPLSSWRSRQIWDRIRGTSRGSVSEHGFAFKFWPRSH